MTLIKWNTTRPSIFSEFDNLFDSFISDFPTLYDRGSSWTPKFEVLNTDNSYRIRADLPGMIKNDVNIEVVNNTLKISGERINDRDESDDYNYSELSYGKFSRTFNLPEDVKENEIKASMKAGVLALEIPRVKPIQPEVKKIKIK
tara:strand:- start:906 stop:1340 length:435 start_codon:yes stop_codon:yes gene_type:complete